MRFQVAQKNAEQGRTGEDISQKDPMEMRMMLQDRLQRSSLRKKMRDQGRLVEWFDDKGYGFIQPNDSIKIVFLSISKTLLAQDLVLLSVVLWSIWSFWMSAVVIVLSKQPI
jgi:hypothetical protein